MARLRNGAAAEKSHSAREFPAPKTLRLCKTLRETHPAFHTTGEAGFCNHEGGGVFRQLR